MAARSVSMRLKTTVTATGATKTKTIGSLAFQTFDGSTDTDNGKAIKVMAQRIVALTTDTYVETDMIVTTNVDTLEVTNLG